MKWSCFPLPRYFIMFSLVYFKGVTLPRKQMQGLDSDSAVGERSVCFCIRSKIRKHKIRLRLKTVHAGLMMEVSVETPQIVSSNILNPTKRWVRCGLEKCRLFYIVVSHVHQLNPVLKIIVTVLIPRKTVLMSLKEKK